MTSVLTMYDTFKSTEKPTAGDTKLSLAAIDHSGWLICDGRTLKISEFYYLFQVIGTTYGAPSSSTFKLPNPAGTVVGIIGSGVGSNGLPLTVRTAGQLVGSETHVLTIAEMPTHNHPGSSIGVSTTGVTDSGHSHSYVRTNDTNHDNAVSLTNSPNNQGTFSSTTGTASAVIVDPGHTHTLTIANQGGSNAHSIMQPTLFVGNMFVYSGKPHLGAHAFTANGIY